MNISQLEGKELESVSKEHENDGNICEIYRVITREIKMILEKLMELKSNQLSAHNDLHHGVLMELCMEMVDALVPHVAPYPHWSPMRAIYWLHCAILSL